MALNNLTPEYVTELKHFSENTHYDLRSFSFKNIIHYRPNTNDLSSTFKIIGLEAWNKLTKSIRISSTSSNSGHS